MSGVLFLQRLGVALIFGGFTACTGSDGHSGSGMAGSASGQPSAGGSGASSDAGDGGKESAGDGEGAGGGAPPTPTTGTCLTDAECDDGRFCNGLEVCRPKAAGVEVKVCMAPEFGPCRPAACDEASNSCDCSDPDQDDDGFNVAGCVAAGATPDCDDVDSTRYPAKQEVCDLAQPKHDEDCDDTTFAGEEADADHDDFLNSECGNYTKYQAIGTSPEERALTRGRDCRDDDPDSHPGAREVCDGIDNNCNGEVDEVSGTPLHTQKVYYRDRDGDHFGVTEDALHTACNIAPPGYAVIGGDCDDNEFHIAPGRAEVCNGKDDDCDRSVDRPLTENTLLLDEPYDGVTKFECTGEPGWVVAQCPPGRLDCDETYQNACETIGTTICNCHDCGERCQFSCGADSCAEVHAVSAGLLHTCMLVKSDPDDGKGTLACTGKNTTGQLGLGTTKDSSVAVAVPDLVGITGVAAGSFHSCAATAAGRAFCWGSNQFGQLGAGSAEPQSNDPLPVLALGEKKVERIAAGSFHSCAIYEGGEVACWGQGVSGQLGDGYEDSTRSPTQVIRMLEGGYDYEYVSGVSQVVAGYEHTCALTAGRVECWGSNQSMQLGADPNVLPNSTTPVLVPGLEDVVVDELAAAAVNTCARAGAKVYCWGGNTYHQLAHDSGAMGPVTLIPLPQDIVRIAVGPFFGCALSAGGAIRCWGINLSGERGTLDETPDILPTLVPLSGATRIFSGNGNHICAIKADRSVWCWGQNDFGQLGNGAATSGPQPLATQVLPRGGAQLCPDVHD